MGEEEGPPGIGAKFCDAFEEEEQRTNANGEKGENQELEQNGESKEMQTERGNMEDAGKLTENETAESESETANSPPNQEESSEIIEANSVDIIQALHSFQQNVGEDDTPTFGVTEPNVVQVKETFSLVIAQTQPSIEKENHEIKINEIEKQQEELLSSRTMSFTVNNILDSIMNDKQQQQQQQVKSKQQQFVQPKQTKQTVQKIGKQRGSMNENQKDVHKETMNLEEKMKRKAHQEEASSRLAKPKPKDLHPIEGDEKTPRKIKSKAEQKEAIERLSKAKTIISNYPQEQTKARSFAKKKTSGISRDRTINSSSPNSKETQIPEITSSPPPPPKATREFKAMMKGTTEKKYSATPAMLPDRNKEIESVCSHQEIVDITNSIISGHKQSIDNSATIADIVNELTNRRIQALKDSEYMQSLKLQQIADEVRKQFRIRDREHFHQDYLRELNYKLQNANESFNKTENQWRERINALNQECESEIEVLNNKHDIEMKELENKWKTPEVIRKFTKKSAQLLVQQTMEKNMALTGDLINAAQMQKVVKKNEIIEASQKYEEMKISFEKERNNLMEAQEHALGLMNHLHELKKSQLSKQKEENLDQHKRRIFAIERIIADESDIDKFCAKKFKKASGFVVPMTVTSNGGDDIPITGRMRSTPLNMAEMMSLRENSVPAPLQLPTLKIQRPKSAKRQRKPISDEI